MKIEIGMLPVWAMVLFVMQCVLFFLPASVEWWMMFFPSIIAICVLFCAIVLFIIGFVYAIVMEIKRRKEMLKIPEK